MSKTVVKVNGRNVFGFEESICWLLSEFIYNVDENGNYLYSNTRYDNFDNLEWMKSKGIIEKFVDKTDFDTDGYVYQIVNFDTDSAKRFIMDCKQVRLYKRFVAKVESQLKKAKSDKRTYLTANEIERKSIDSLRKQADEKYKKLEDVSYSL